MNANEDIILYFIYQFKGSEDTFLNGCCYWFAEILYHRFKSQENYVAIYYVPIDNHFVTLINDQLYDIRGNVTNLYSTTAINWTEYQTRDKLETERLYRDCIRKDKND